MMPNAGPPDEPERPRGAMELETLGKVLLVAGAVAFALGGALVLLSRVAGLGGLRLFDLPGDLRFQTGNLTCILPIVSFIILSIAATIIVNLIIRILNR